MPPVAVTIMLTVCCGTPFCSNTEAMEKFAEAIYVFAKEKNAAVALANAQPLGAITFITEAMRGNADSSTVSKFASLTLLEFVNQGVDGKKFRDPESSKSCLSDLVDAAKFHQEARISALTTISLLAKQGIFSEIGADESAMSACAEMLNEYPEQPDICAATLSILGNLATSEESRPVLESAGIAASVLKILKKHIDNADVKAKSYHAMCFLLKNGGASKDTCMQENLLQSLSKVMLADCFTEPAVIASGAAVFACLLKGNDEAKKEALHEDLKVAEMIANSMSTHSGDIDVQKKLMPLVVNLAGRKEEENDADSALCNANIVDALKNVIPKHKTDMTFARAVLPAIQALCVEPKVCSSMIKAGIIEEIVEIINTFPSDPQVQLGGSSAISNFDLDTDAKDVLSRAEAKVSVFFALKARYFPIPHFRSLPGSEIPFFFF